LSFVDTNLKPSITATIETIIVGVYLERIAQSSLSQAISNCHTILNSTESSKIYEPIAINKYPINFL